MCLVLLVVNLVVIAFALTLVFTLTDSQYTPVLAGTSTAISLVSAIAACVEKVLKVKWRWDRREAQRFTASLSWSS